MIRTTLIAAAGLLLAPLPVTAQSQEELDARYDRALAAGYEALFLCGALSSAERAGAARTAESVQAWEFQGIYGRLGTMVEELDYRISRDAAENVALVEVEWTDDMPPRFAEVRGDEGCALAPIGLQPSMPETVAPGGSGNAAVPIRTMPSPEQAGPFANAFTAALSGEYGDDSRTTAVLVRYGGQDFSRYAEGFSAHTPQRTWSVAKSIAATLVGAAVQRGDADVEATGVFDDWRSDARRTITIDDLLRMASGRYSDTPGNRTDPLYMGGATVEESAANWPLLYEPGTVFRYANNDTLMAVKAIEGSFDTFEPADLFNALGMDNTTAETDWAGDFILSSQVWSTAPDLAALGQLHLDDGLLPDGTRLLPENWVEYISSPSGPQPDGRSWGYGAGWWLLNAADGIPADAFMAAGNRGQYIVVIPSRDVVIVRRGEDPAGGSGFDVEAFTRDILSALEN